MLKRLGTAVLTPRLHCLPWGRRKGRRGRRQREKKGAEGENSTGRVMAGLRRGSPRAQVQRKEWSGKGRPGRHQDTSSSSRPGPKLLTTQPHGQLWKGDRELLTWFEVGPLAWPQRKSLKLTVFSHLESDRPQHQRAFMD